MLQHKGAKTSNRCPCSLPEERGRAGLLSGVKVEVDLWVGPEGGLRWCAHPLGGVSYRDHAQDPAFAPDSSEVALD